MKIKVCDICNKPIEPKSILSGFLFRWGINIKAQTIDFKANVDICPECIQKIIDEVRGGKQ